MKDEILIISTPYQEIWMIWISLLDYYIDSHYSLSLNSEYSKTNIYWTSTVVGILSFLCECTDFCCVFRPKRAAMYFWWRIVASRVVNSCCFFIINYCFNYFGSELDHLHSVNLRSSDFLTWSLGLFLVIHGNNCTLFISISLFFPRDISDSSSKKNLSDNCFSTENGNEIIETSWVDWINLNGWKLQPPYPQFTSREVSGLGGQW